VGFLEKLSVLDVNGFRGNRCWQNQKASFQPKRDLRTVPKIHSAIVLREYLVATIVVLMLSGGEALEEFATARAASVLDALARRMPSIAHRKEARGLVDVRLADIRVGDELTVLPHEICPVDGTVLEGHGVMDEAYLTGEPYEISKTPGSMVISGAINGEALLTIRAERLAVSRADIIAQFKTKEADCSASLCANQLDSLYGLL
jgi:cation transport ATPase